MRTLLYYAITEEGKKIVRNRRYCPQANRCGPGIRLAKHADRIHCGKCGQTYRNIEGVEKW